MEDFSEQYVECVRYENQKIKLAQKSLQTITVYLVTVAEYKKYSKETLIENSQLILGI